MSEEQAVTPKQQYDFGDALKKMKEGAEMTRVGWNNPTISVKAQYPTDTSKMTKPYLYMIKGNQMFPLDLSAESIFAEDWIEV